MSVISLLVIHPDRLPSLAELRAEAERGGEPVEFGYDADLKTHTGFLPLQAFGRETGFEFYFDEIPPGELPADAMAFGSHNIIARTGSSFEEGRAALLFLKIAARLTGGAYVYPDDGVLVAPDEVGSYLAGQIDEYGKFIK